MTESILNPTAQESFGNPERLKIIREGIRSPEVILERFGLPANQVIELWKDANCYRDKDTHFNRNIRKMVDLELAVPGAVQRLFFDYGIVMFGRYPLDLLVDQAKSQSSSAEWGWIVNPHHDNTPGYEGAFFEMEEVYKKLFKDLQKEGVGLKVMEVSSAYELVQKLNMGRKLYGPAEFALIGSHGDENQLQFGKAKGKGDITLQELAGMRFAATSLGFGNRPTIIIDSCRAGRKFAPRIRDLGSVAVGPKNNDTLSSIAVKRDVTGKLSLKPTYYYGPSITHTPR